MSRLELRGVTVAYDNFTLSDISFFCGDGEIVALIGRNGARLDEMVIQPAALWGGLGLCALVYAISIYLSLRRSRRFSTI